MINPHLNKVWFYCVQQTYYSIIGYNCCQVELSSPSMSATQQWQLSVKGAVGNNGFIHNGCNSYNIEGLVQDCSISIANTQEIQLSFTKTLICPIRYAHIYVEHCFVADISTKYKCNSTMTAVCLITHCIIVFLALLCSCRQTPPSSCPHNLITLSTLSQELTAW